MTWVFSPSQWFGFGKCEYDVLYEVDVVRDEEKDLYMGITKEHYKGKA